MIKPHLAVLALVLFGSSACSPSICLESWWCPEEAATGGSDTTNPTTTMPSTMPMPDPDCQGGGADEICQANEPYMTCRDCFCGNSQRDVRTDNSVEDCDDGGNNIPVAMTGWALDERCSQTQCAIQPSCGNDMRDGPDESCDPSDNSDPNRTYCRGNCQGYKPYSGDGVCDKDELIAWMSHADCTTPVCGDGIVMMGEGCDDASGDTATCNGPGGGPAACQPSDCGDGYLNPKANNPVEQCDDGNKMDGDGCSSTCKNEVIDCGDGIKSANEECDDALDPACANCQLPRRVFVTEDVYKPGQMQNAALGIFSGVAGADTICRDLATKANLNKPGYTWIAWLSDGDVDPSKASSTSSRVPLSNTGFQGRYRLFSGIVVANGWAGLTSVPHLSAINQTQSGGPVGDPLGAWTNTTPAGMPAGTADCTNWTAPSLNSSSVYGDVTKTTVEWTQASLATCSNPLHFYCLEVSQCGDGEVQAGEECDDKNAVDTDACRNNCRAARCGDGVVQAGEECDDGNVSGLDACSATCKPTGCGDGVIQAGEQCDDANSDDTDLCRNNCTKATCGDGVVWALREYCDDGNDIDTDACRNDCTPAGCGDGVVWEGSLEECDDGNTVDTDACRNKCLLPKCGDKVVWEGMEECDDGNTKDDDDCRNDCTKNN